VLASDRTLEHAEGAFLARDAGAITGDVESEPQRAYVVAGELRERVDAEAGLLVEM